MIDPRLRSVVVVGIVLGTVPRWWLALTPYAGLVALGTGRWWARNALPAASTQPVP